MTQKNRRKPFVAPRLKEEASLADVTLITGGGGQPTFRRYGRVNKFKRYGGHRHGGGHSS